jgi:hypothetical protein
MKCIMQNTLSLSIYHWLHLRLYGVNERAILVNQVEHHVEYTTELRREQLYYEVHEGGIHEVNSAASRNEWNLGRLIAASSSDKEYGSASSTNSRQTCFKLNIEAWHGLQISRLHQHQSLKNSVLVNIS